MVMILKKDIFEIILLKNHLIIIFKKVSEF